MKKNNINYKRFNMSMICFIFVIVSGVVIGSRSYAQDLDPVIQAIVDDVDLTRLQTTLETLVSVGSREVEEVGYAESADWALAEFRSYGLEAKLEPLPEVYYGSVIAYQPGTVNPERIWVLGAHLDSINREGDKAPGADDNASGCALVIETARMLAKHRFEDTIVYALWCAEETGPWGSNAYARIAQNQELDIQGNFNFDMIGYVDAAPEDLDITTNAASMDMADALAAAGQYAGLDSAIHMETDSDHTAFWRYGFRGVIGCEDYPTTYPYAHTAEDTLEKVDVGFVRQCTQAACAALCDQAILLSRKIFMVSCETDDTAGDGDGEIDPGETVELIIRLENWNATPAQNVQLDLELITGSELVTIGQGTADFGNLALGEGTSNSDNPFVISTFVASPEYANIEIQLNITADEGLEYSDILELNIESSLMTLWDWNMDTDPGWTMTGNWAWGQPTGGSGSTGHSDPTSGYTGANVVGYNLNGGFENNMTEKYCTVGPLDFTWVHDCELSFYRWLGVGRDYLDRAKIQVSTDGVTYDTLWKNPDDIEDDHWKLQHYELPSFVNGQETVWLRWVMGPTNQGGTYGGWNIDDVAISGHQATTPGNELGVRLEMVSPVARPGQTFHLFAHLANPDVPRQQVPVFLFLEVMGEFWFWPGWTYFSSTGEGSVDFQYMEIPTGVTPIRILDDFQWPETGNDNIDGLRFWGAMTDDSMSSILGSYSVVEWGYGP